MVCAHLRDVGRFRRSSKCILPFKHGQVKRHPQSSMCCVYHEPQVWEEKIIERVKKPGFFTDQEELNTLFEVRLRTVNLKSILVR